MENITDYKYLLGPISQFLTAILAFVGIIYIQIQQDKRSRKDINSRFDEQQKQHQHEIRITEAKERLSNIEPIFNLLFTISLMHNEIYKTYISPYTGRDISPDEVLKNVELIKNELNSTFNDRVRLRMLIHLYVPELKSKLAEYENSELDLSLTCLSYMSKSASNTEDCFYSLETRYGKVIKSISKLQEHALELPRFTPE